MPVELTPSGTRGATMPPLPKALMKLLMPLGNAFLRARGLRLLTLTTVDGRKRRVSAESLSGEAREQAWRRIVAAAPMYAGYPEKTDRRIPVVRLTPA